MSIKLLVVDPIENALLNLFYFVNFPLDTWWGRRRSLPKRHSSDTTRAASRTSRSARTSTWVPHAALRCRRWTWTWPTPPSGLDRVEDPALPDWTPCKCRAFRPWPGMDHPRSAVVPRCSKLNRILFLYPTVRRWLAISEDGVTHCGLAIIPITPTHIKHTPPISFSMFVRLIRFTFPRLFVTF